MKKQRSIAVDGNPAYSVGECAVSGLNARPLPCQGTSPKEDCNELVVTIGEVAEIRLTRGCVAVIDAEDAEKARKYRWHATGRAPLLYAASNAREGYLFLHRYLMSAPPGMVVDHRDGNRMNNRRANLRICTQQFNTRNKRKASGVYSSTFKGVSWMPKKGKWRAYITLSGEQKHLGLFVNEHDAARAYDAEAVRLFGEFALLNFQEVTAQ